MLSPTSLALHLPAAAFRACEAVVDHAQLFTAATSVKAASWNPTAIVRLLLVRCGVAELVFGELALEQVNGALRDAA